MSCKGCLLLNLAGRCSITQERSSVHFSLQFCPHPDGPRYGSAERPEKTVQNYLGTPSAPNQSDYPFEIGSIKSIPRSVWPSWAKAVALKSLPSDIGVGSTIERELGRVGVAFKAVLATLGVPCGCADRRDEWNALYPYTLTPASGPTP